jgi:hypothetical protein
MACIEHGYGGICATGKVNNEPSSIKNPRRREPRTQGHL